MSEGENVEGPGPAAESPSPAPDIVPNASLITPGSIVRGFVAKNADLYRRGRNAQAQDHAKAEAKARELDIPKIVPRGDSEVVRAAHPRKIPQYRDPHRVPGTLVLPASTYKKSLAEARAKREAIERARQEEIASGIATRDEDSGVGDVAGYNNYMRAAYGINDAAVFIEDASSKTSTKDDEPASTPKWQPAGNIASFSNLDRSTVNTLRLQITSATSLDGISTPWDVYVKGNNPEFKQNDRIALSGPFKKEYAERVLDKCLTLIGDSATDKTLEDSALKNPEIIPCILTRQELWPREHAHRPTTKKNQDRSEAYYVALPYDLAEKLCDNKSPEGSKVSGWLNRFLEPTKPTERGC